MVEVVEDNPNVEPDPIEEKLTPGGDVEDEAETEEQDSEE